MFELFSLSVNSVAALLTFAYIIKLLVEGVPGNSIPNKHLKVRPAPVYPAQTRGAIGMARNTLR